MPACSATYWQKSFLRLALRVELRTLSQIPLSSEAASQGGQGVLVLICPPPSPSQTLLKIGEKLASLGQYHSVREET